MKKAVIVVVSVIVAGAIAVVLIAGRKADAVKAFKASFTPTINSIKIMPKSGTPFSLNVVALVESGNIRTSTDCKVERDVKGHVFIDTVLSNPKVGAQNYKIWLADNTVIVKLPGKVSRGFSPMPTTWYYKFKNSTIEKLKSDFNELKELNGKNGYAGNIKNLLCLLKVSKVTYARSGNSTVATIVVPLKKWIENCKKDSDKRSKEGKIIIDMANTIFDDLTSETSLTEKQTEEIKKNMDNTLSKLLNEKPNYEKYLTNTDKATVTITYGTRSGLISKLTVEPVIKNSPQISGKEYVLNFSYGENGKISSVKGKINDISFILTPRYENGKIYGALLTANGNNFKINLTSEMRANDNSFGLIKVPPIYTASNLRRIIDLILSGLNGW